MMSLFLTKICILLALGGSEAEATYVCDFFGGDLNPHLLVRALIEPDLCSMLLM
jgi:hypothetical protein